jgi:hypothetical protein
MPSRHAPSSSCLRGPARSRNRTAAGRRRAEFESRPGVPHRRPGRRPPPARRARYRSHGGRRTFPASAAPGPAPADRHHVRWLKSWRKSVPTAQLLGKSQGEGGPSVMVWPMPSRTRGAGLQGSAGGGPGRGGYAWSAADEEFGQNPGPRASRPRSVRARSRFDLMASGRWPGDEMERLRRPPTRTTGTAMARALDQVNEISAFRLGRVDPTRLPVNRLSRKPGPGRRRCGGRCGARPCAGPDRRSGRRISPVQRPRGAVKAGPGRLSARPPSVRRTRSRPPSAGGTARPTGRRGKGVSNKRRIC